MYLEAINYEIYDDDCDDDDNGPKRRETRRLGHRWVFFYFIRVLMH